MFSFIRKTRGTKRSSHILHYLPEIKYDVSESPRWLESKNVRVDRINDGNTNEQKSKQKD